jgi:two-component system, response regulator PdtaR
VKEADADTRLPRASGAGRARGQPTVPFAAPDGGSTGKAAGHKVLLVEDDHLVALDLEDALRGAGFEVIGPAVSADEAIGLARAHRPALAIMDIRLAGTRDGVDAALELYRDLGLRCLFATAYQDAPTRRRAEGAAPLGWIGKPYHPGALVRAVRDALAKLGG